MTRPAHRPKKYDFDKILPEICEEYIDSNKSIKAILEDRGGPSFSQFWRVVSQNPLYSSEWELAQKTKAELLDSDFVEIDDLAMEAFRNKNLNVNALKIRSDNLKTRRGQLNAKFNDNSKSLTLEAGSSMRELLSDRIRRADERLKIIEGDYKEIDDG